MAYANPTARRAADARYERGARAMLRRAVRASKRGPCMLCGNPTGDRGKGPVRLYCSHACRRKDWEIRKRER